MKRKFKIVALILSLVLAVGLFAACGGSDTPAGNGGNSGGNGGGNGGNSGGGGGTPSTNYTYVDFDTDANVNITVDGIKNEAAYNAIPAFTFGIRAEAKAYFAASKEGLYVFFEVDDKTLYYSNEDVYVADCVEFYLDSDNTSRANPRKTTRQIQVSPRGDYAIYKGDVEQTWVLLGRSLNGATTGVVSDKAAGFAVATTHNGTVSPIGTDPGAKNDNGYTAEIFLSWASMEVDVRTVESNQYGESGVVGVAFGHTDIINYNDKTNSRVSYMNDVANTSPLKYHKLKLVGDYKGVSTPTVASEITIDGNMNEAQWATATVVGATSVTAASGDATIDARAFFGNNGLYVGVKVVGDTKLEAWISTIGDGVYKNDGCEMRIHVMDASGQQIRSFKLLYDLFGMCWHDSPAGTPGACDELYAITTNGTINNNSDVDTGWCMELFIPNYELQADAMENGYIVSTRTLSYAQILVGVQNYYITDTDNATNPYAQAPEVAIAATATWDSVGTYATVRK